jgi:small-conductance mechanosensitive channel
MFNDFGDSSLNFGIYFFVRDSFAEPRIKSALRFAIDKAFRENGVTIPFPQRDLHIISRPSVNEGSNARGND